MRNDEYPEFAVSRESLSNFFSPPLAKSTFYDLVNRGKIFPVSGVRGYYRLNTVGEQDVAFIQMLHEARGDA